MEYSVVLLSICAGLVSGICWLVGDVLLVGFEVDQKRYSQFTKGSLIGNKELAMLMLPASKKRLRWGALLANFSIPLMLAGLYSLFMLIYLFGMDWRFYFWESVLFCHQWLMLLFTMWGLLARWLMSRARESLVQFQMQSLLMKWCCFWI